ncbi:EcsC family protein [Actinoplanes sp. NPDC020271]|uniref:EcsC family protein n=1 Tax=Actinoplanes sp. NPDC020271 TaxID=3363896 RepID=UPI0037A93D74
MSEYETRAWADLLNGERKRRTSARTRVAGKVALVTKRAGEQLRKVPGAGKALEVGDETIGKALEGAFKAVFLPSVRSVSLDRRVEKLRSTHPDLDAESLFTSLDLKELDKGRPALTIPFLGVVESGVASVVVTGATVSTTVSGGTTAGVALLAVASDAAASLALLGRAVAEVAVHYGYDPEEPGEELFLMGVLNYSMASSSASKTAAMASLSRLTQQMMRRATWEQLGKAPVVKVLSQIFKLLGFKLTKTKLAQVVPIAGSILSAGLSFNMLHSAIDDATRLYRARYLAEKHGLSWDEWVAQPSPAAADAVVDATVDEIDDLLDEVTAGEPRPDAARPPHSQLSASPPETSAP